jgi:hypothetical protein
MKIVILVLDLGYIKKEQVLVIQSQSLQVKPEKAQSYLNGRFVLNVRVPQRVYRKRYEHDGHQFQHKDKPGLRP